jgi:hypothetical protein
VEPLVPEDEPEPPQAPHMPAVRMTTAKTQRIDRRALMVRSGTWLDEFPTNLAPLEVAIPLPAPRCDPNEKRPRDVERGMNA